MRKARVKECFGGLLLLAVMLVANTVAHAENTLDSTREEPPAPYATKDAWIEDHMHRKDFRENMERLRMEHGQVTAERDQIKTHCMNAVGQERNACEARKQLLRERVKALHQRRAAMREQFRTGTKGQARNTTQHPETERPVEGMSVQQ